MHIIWNDSEFETIPKVHQDNSLLLASKLNKLCKMTHSVTYTPGLDLSYLLDIANITGIRNVRFALSVSEMHRCVEPQYLEILIQQLRLLVTNGFTITPDHCGFIPNSIPALYKLRIHQLMEAGNRCIGNAIDVLPDGRIIPCQPYLDEPKDMFVEDIQSAEHLQEMFVKHYGPQSSRKVNQGMCPAVYERPVSTKIIPILRIPHVAEG